MVDWLVFMLPLKISELELRVFLDNFLLLVKTHSNGIDLVI